jgi:hypothetical protein
VVNHRLVANAFDCLIVAMEQANGRFLRRSHRRVAARNVCFGLDAVPGPSLDRDKHGSVVAKFFSPNSRISAATSYSAASKNLLPHLKMRVLLG